jgi:hypothetical protein
MIAQLYSIMIIHMDMADASNALLHASHAPQLQFAQAASLVYYTMVSAELLVLLHYMKIQRSLIQT